MTNKLKEFSKFFDNHELKIECNSKILKSFLCKKNDNSHFWFRVIFSPNHINLYGSIGDITFNVSDSDSLSWLLSIENTHISYLMSKVPYNLQKTIYTFSEEVALHKLSDLELNFKNEIRDEENFDSYDIQEFKTKIKKINELKRDIQNLTDSEFYERFNNDINYGSCDYPDFKDYTDEAYAIGAALFKFCELFNSSEIKNIENLMMTENSEQLSISN